MKLYPKGFIDELMARSNIVDVISRYVRGVTKRGRKHFACCPFHHEKTPSFVINEYEQYYHCFGCGKSGNVIKFVMEIENIGYPEAVAVLARYANMTVPEPDDDGGKQMELKKKKDKLYAVLKETARFYHESLKTKGAAALEYLRERRIDDAVIVRFGLGYSPDYTGLYAHLKAVGFDDVEITDSGAGTKTQNGKIIDAMAGRLVFPIINSYNDVIGFSGRILEKKDGVAKYKNTGATAVFDKSRSLYGVNLLKKEKQQNGISDVILVEGHIDLLSLNGAGIKNCVAGMGTAFTKYQAALIKRYCDKAYIAYDGDKAGQNAALKGLDILADEGLEVRVILLTEGLDPDDVIKKYGREYFLELKERALPLYEYKIHALKNNYDLSSGDERGKFAMKALDVVKPLGSEVLAEPYVGLISELSGISNAALKKELQKTTDTTANDTQNNNGEMRSKDEKKGVKTESAYIYAARFILNALIFKKSFAEYNDDIEGCLSDETHKEIFAYLKKCKEKSAEPLVSSLYEEAENTPELDAVIIPEKIFTDKKDEKKYYDDSLKLIKKESLNREKYRLGEKAKAETDVGKRNKIVSEIAGIIKKISKI